METQQIQQIYDDDFMLSRLIAGVDRKNVKVNVVEPQLQTNRKTKRTYMFNFEAFCNSIRRDKQHLKLYLESELSVDTSISENGMLTIDKPFDSKRVTSILEQYVNIYVQCKETKCKSLCTVFIKEDRINYLTCEICNSRHAMTLKISHM